jgi:hypothetical protein
MNWFRRWRRKVKERSVAERSPTEQSVPEVTADVDWEDEDSILVADAARAARRFWGWWTDALPRISSALGDREPNRVEHELSAAVAAIHADLHFSLDRGQQAVYALVVSGQEDPVLRPYTDAWKAAAPPDDVIWEFHDSVPPVPDPNSVTVNLSGQRISLADVRVVAQIDAAEGVVDVAVYHPALSELDDRGRTTMTFLPLDATLGERLAGERLRRVETALHEPSNAITLRQLRDLVRQLADADPASESTADS